MKKALLAIALLLATGAMPTQAATITWDMKCEIGGTGVDCGDFVYGTLTLDDIVGGVDAELTSVAGGKFGGLYLNSNLVPTDITGDDVDGWSYAANLKSADGYPGFFDIQIDFDTGGGPTNVPLSFFIAGVGTSDLDLFDTLGNLHVAAHLQNCGANTPDCAQGNSIWVGGGTTTQVPEPGTLSLLGLGLVALAAGLRRRK